MGRAHRRSEGGHAWGVVLLALVTGLFAGCTVTGTLRSRVLDAQTGQPVVGAIALAVWTTTEGIPGMYVTTLLGVQEAETDAHGRFTLERLATGIYAGLESITVYKFGYVAWNNRLIFPTHQRRENMQVPAQIQLAPFPPWGSHERHRDFIASSVGSIVVGNQAPKFDAAIDQARKRPTPGLAWGVVPTSCPAPPNRPEVRTPDLNAWLGQLAAPDPVARAQAADALGACGTAETTEALCALLQHPTPYVRQAAARALGKLQDTRAVEPLLDRLKDPDVFVQFTAAMALAELHDSRAIEPLWTLFHTAPNEEIRAQYPVL